MITKENEKINNKIQKNLKDKISKKIFFKTHFCFKCTRKGKIIFFLRSQVFFNFYYFKYKSVKGPRVFQECPSHF